MKLSFTPATDADALAIAALRASVAAALTRQFGRGHWSSAGTERGVLHNIHTSALIAARLGATLVGTLRLATKKPWSIDTSYFSSSPRPLYLTDMAVDPAHQRQGIGRLLVEEARTMANAWPADAIRLDAYDAAAGAGPFYRKCGFTEVGRASYRGNPLIYYELLL